MPLITYRYCVCVACDTDIKMLPALLSIEPEKVYALPDHSLADDDFKLMATLSDLADRELVATIGWAKQVPGKPVCLESFSDCLSSFFHMCVRVFVDGSFVERLCPQFFSNFHQILRAALQCGDVDAYCL